MLKHLREPHDGLPQTIFLLPTPWGTFLGKKKVSRLFLQQRINEPFDSLIDEDMLLGDLRDLRLSEEWILAYYEPISAKARRAAFDRVLQRPQECEIRYPFPSLVTDRRLEMRSRPEGWPYEECSETGLAAGEIFLVEESARALRALGFSSGVLYDPACSTGVFLEAMKKRFPKATTVGQDLSASMVRNASRRIDHAVTGNALYPRLAPGMADVLVCRFLNTGVVTTRFAHAAFFQLARCLRKGGHMVLLGHTPVLVDASFFELSGFDVTQTIGRATGSRQIFQFYVIRKSRAVRAIPGLSAPERRELEIVKRTDGSRVAIAGPGRHIL